MGIFLRDFHIWGACIYHQIHLKLIIEIAFHSQYTPPSILQNCLLLHKSIGP